MKRVLHAALASAALLVPSSALGAAAAQDLVAAMDIPSNLLAGGISTPNSSPTMFDVRSSLGNFSAQNAPTTALLSTGNVDNITQLQDYDYPGSGADTSAGDHATIQFDLAVPQYANSFSFNFNFFSREYPEWVGQAYNDTFEVWLDSQSYQGQIVFDAFGNPVTVNNALFAVTNPTQLVGTGFDQDGATGWVTTIAPCTGGETMSISFEVYDVADGVWDSAVMIDNFQFSETPPPGDGPWTGDDTPENPISVFFVSPKEGSLDGGNPITLHGVNFTPDITVFVGGTAVTDITVDGSDALVLNSLPSADAAGVAGGGPVDIVLTRGPEEVVLGDGYTYWDGATGEVPPRVTSVVPSSARPDAVTEIRVRGIGFDVDSAVSFIGEDEDGNPVVGEAQVEVVQELEGGMEIILKTPEMASGWTEIVVENSNGLISAPGYPFQFSSDAAAPPDNNGGGSSRGCNSIVASSGSPAFLLLFLFGGALLRRRSR
ncbi:MAG: choice-of-anchor L domain-containing protein [Deltaproteobacteria bacterium]|nr:choice-of-anchor L domain-containing protein [Deltaproteobacteria bacterium]